jgi:hypothetical protein
MQKKTIVLLFTLVLIMLAAASFSTIPVKAANWQTVTTITGSGSKTSDEFRISGSEWRIKWTYTPNGQEPSLTSFSFFVYPHGETAVYVDRVIEYGASSTSGTLNIHEGPKLYYVKILTANTPSYTLTVECDADSVVSDSLLAIIIVAAIGVPIILMIVIAVVVRKRVKKRKQSLKSISIPPPPPPPFT